MLLIAVITADPEIILKRRLKDINHRPDRQCNLSFIKNEQKLEIKIARSQAVKMGTKFCLIPNKNKNIKKTSELLLKYCLQQYLLNQ